MQSIKSQSQRPGWTSCSGFIRGATRCRRGAPAKGALNSWSWLQGFQALAADQGGFGGLAADVMGALRDEYARMPTLLFAMRPAAQGPADADGQVCGNPEARMSRAWPAL